MPTRRTLLLCALLIATVTAATVRAQPSWQWIDPSPTGNDLSDIVVASDGALLIVGRHGSVLASTDDGASWHVRHTGDYRLLRAVAFASETEAWSVGDSRAVVRSSDGGRTWWPVDIGSAGLFHDVAFSSPGVGVIVGGVELNERGLLRTTDGGASWSVVTLPVTPTLMDAEFRDAVGLAVGHGGTILRTTDRGATWSIGRVDSPGEGGVLDAVRFVTDSVVVAVGESGRILRSNDAGRSWTKVRSQPYGNAFHAVAFGDSLRGVAVGERGAPLFTTDGGLTWSATDDPTNAVMSVTFADPTSAWMVGPHGFIARSSDAGRTWRTTSRNAGVPTYLGIDVDADGRMVAVGERGAVVVSDTALTGARSIASSGRMRLNAVAWTPDGGFVTVGEKGTMLRSTAPSGPLAPHATGVTAGLHDVVIDDQGHGYVVGAGVVLKTTDGGRRWTALQAPSTDVITAVATPDESTVWVVGRRGLIFRSTDGGVTWRDRRSPTPNYLSDVHALDSMRAVVVGAAGVAIRTTDGGLTWTFARVEGNPDLSRVTFVDPLRGVAVGGEGVASVTTDGGVSWTRRDVPIRMTSVSVVHMTGVTSYGSRAVAVGTGGVILSYDFGLVAGVKQHSVEHAQPRVRYVDGRLEVIGAGEVIRSLLVDPIGRVVSVPEIAPGRRLVLDDLSLASGTYFLLLELSTREWITLPIHLAP